MLLAGMGSACWKGLARVGGGPGGDHRHADAALPLRALLAAHRPIAEGSGGQPVLGGGGAVAAVVAEEDDQGVLGHAEVDEFLADLAHRDVHALDHGGELAVVVVDGRTVVAGGVRLVVNGACTA